MFSYSLINGKKQLRTGLQLLILIAVLLALFGLIIVIMVGCHVNETALSIVGSIFAIILGVLGLLSIIKIIFGAIVYHAERTSSRNEKTIISDNTKY